MDKKVIGAMLASVLATTQLSAINVYANESIEVNRAKAKLQHIDWSLKNNYMGLKNQATWEMYLREATALIGYIPNDILNKGIKSELSKEVDGDKALVLAIARINHVEKSMTPKEQGGLGNALIMKNVPTWLDYIDKAEIDLLKVDKSRFNKQIQELEIRIELVKAKVELIKSKDENEKGLQSIKDELEKLKNDYNANRDKIDKLEKELKDKDDKIKELEDKLKNGSTGGSTGGSNGGSTGGSNGGGSTDGGSTGGGSTGGGSTGGGSTGGGSTGGGSTGGGSTGGGSTGGGSTGGGSTGGGSTGGGSTDGGSTGTGNGDNKPGDGNGDNEQENKISRTILESEISIIKNNDSTYNITVSNVGLGDVIKVYQSHGDTVAIAEVTKVDKGIGLETASILNNIVSLNGNISTLELLDNSIEIENLTLDELKDAVYLTRTEANKLESLDTEFVYNQELRNINKIIKKVDKARRYEDASTVTVEELNIASTDAVTPKQENESKYRTVIVVGVNDVTTRQDIDKIVLSGDSIATIDDNISSGNPVTKDDIQNIVDEGGSSIQVPDSVVDDINKGISDGTITNNDTSELIKLIKQIIAINLIETVEKNGDSSYVKAQDIKDAVLDLAEVDESLIEEYRKQISIAEDTALNNQGKIANMVNKVNAIMKIEGIQKGTSADSITLEDLNKATSGYEGILEDNMNFYKTFISIAEDLELDTDIEIKDSIDIYNLVAKIENVPQDGDASSITLDDLKKVINDDGTIVIDSSLNDYLESVSKAVDNTFNSTDDIRGMIDDINTQKELEKARQELQELYDKASAIVKEDVTEESWISSNIEEELLNAKTILDSNNTSLNEIVQAKHGINDSMGKLIYKGFTNTRQVHDALIQAANNETLDGLIRDLDKIPIAYISKAKTMEFIKSAKEIIASGSNEDKQLKLKEYKDSIAKYEYSYTGVYSTTGLFNKLDVRHYNKSLQLDSFDINVIANGNKVMSYNTEDNVANRTERSDYDTTYLEEVILNLDLKYGELNNIKLDYEVYANYKDGTRRLELLPLDGNMSEIRNIELSVQIVRKSSDFDVTADFYLIDGDFVINNEILEKNILGEKKVGNKKIIIGKGSKTLINIDKYIFKSSSVDIFNYGELDIKGKEDYLDLDIFNFNKLIVGEGYTSDAYIRNFGDIENRGIMTRYMINYGIINNYGTMEQYSMLVSDNTVINNYGNIGLGSGLNLWNGGLESEVIKNIGGTFSTPEINKGSYYMKWF